MNKEEIARISKKKISAVVLVFAAALSVAIFAAKGVSGKKAAGGILSHTLVIDAGHGGIDGGAVGADGSRESDINLAIAMKLRALAEFYGLDNTMVRSDDSSKSPAESYSEHEDLVCRTEIINNSHNPILISIHQNSFPTGLPSGAQVIYSSSEGSELLGTIAHTNLIGTLDPMNRRLAEPASKNLYILSHVSCPAILVECGFMSNFSDICKLTDDSYQTSVSAVLMASYLQFNVGTINT